MVPCHDASTAEAPAGLDAHPSKSPQARLWPRRARCVRGGQPMAAASPSRAACLSVRCLLQTATSCSGYRKAPRDSLAAYRPDAGTAARVLSRDCLVAPQHPAPGPPGSSRLRLVVRALGLHNACPGQSIVQRAHGPPTRPHQPAKAIITSFSLSPSHVSLMHPDPPGAAAGA